MSNKVKIIFVAIAICCGFAVIGTLVILDPNNRPYEPRYFEKLGTSKKIFLYSYNDMLQDFGEPMDVIVDHRGFAKAIYDDFVLTFRRKSGSATLVNVKIISPRYRFGRQAVGLGSAKKEIEEAYSKVKRSPDSGWNYIDGDIYVEFVFDEKDIVESIVFFNYGY